MYLYIYYICTTLLSLQFSLCEESLPSLGHRTCRLGATMDIKFRWFHVVFGTSLVHSTFPSTEFKNFAWDRHQVLSSGERRATFLEDIVLQFDRDAAKSYAQRELGGTWALQADNAKYHRWGHYVSGKLVDYSWDYVRVQIGHFSRVVKFTQRSRTLGTSLS